MDRKAWAVAALTLLFTILQYVDPERKVLTTLHLPAFTIRNLDVFGLLASLGMIALIVMGFRRLGRVNEKADAAVRVGREIEKKVAMLETSMLENVNQTGRALNDNLRATRADLERQLAVLRQAERLPSECLITLDSFIKRGETHLETVRQFIGNTTIDTTRIDEWESEVHSWIVKEMPAFAKDFLAESGQWSPTTILKVLHRLDREIERTVISLVISIIVILVVGLPRQYDFRAMRLTSALSAD